jgi:hypothetical protein
MKERWRRKRKSTIREECERKRRKTRKRKRR